MGLDMGFSLRYEEKAKVYVLGFPWERLRHGVCNQELRNGLISFPLLQISTRPQNPETLPLHVAVGPSLPRALLVLPEEPGGVRHTGGEDGSGGQARAW